MGYFGNNIGKRPAQVVDPANDKVHGIPEATPLFGAAAGARPAAVCHEALPRDEALPAPAKPAAPALRCPLCLGDLVDEHGIWRCAGRCGGRWVEETPGRLLDLAALPYGVCGCCERPQPLVRADGGAACPRSGSCYLLLPEGPRLATDAAPNGLCPCCMPPEPLIWRDGALSCRARPANRFQRVDGRLIPATDPAATLAAIDAALRRNSALVTMNGLFELD
jgi:hypothetical protein